VPLVGALELPRHGEAVSEVPRMQDCYYSKCTHLSLL
jgi:hypothetical protein